MTIVALVFILLIFSGAQIAEQGNFYEDYISRRQTTAINGIFVLFVFMSHYMGGITPAPEDMIVKDSIRFLDHLVVAPFLFYSGFGVMVLISKRGMQYVKQIPLHRALRIQIHFSVAVLLFCGMNVLMKTPMSFQGILLALIGWENVGNYNWYMFAIFVFYMITAISFLICQKSKLVSLIICTTLSSLYIIILRPIKPLYWYSTAMCYVFGMWYGYLRTYIEKIVTKNGYIYCGTILCALTVFKLIRDISYESVWVYQAYCMCFLVMLVAITMKIRFRNSFLEFLGNHAFSIFMLQKLPLLFFERTGFLSNSVVSKCLIVFLSSCVIAIIFDELMGKLDFYYFKLICRKNRCVST